MTRYWIVGTLLLAALGGVTAKAAAQSFTKADKSYAAGASSWIAPAGDYSVSFKEVDWVTVPISNASALFTAKPRQATQNKRQCWSTMLTTPVSGCGGSQSCLNKSMSQMSFARPDMKEFSVNFHEVDGINVGDTSYELMGLSWRQANFALPNGVGVAMHELFCVVPAPASVQDKTAINIIMSTLKFRASSR